MRTIPNVGVAGKKILVRADLDVPIEDNQVIDDFRLRAGLPTLKNLIKNRAAQVTIIGHRGRPEGANSTFALFPVARCLSVLLNCHPEAKPKDPSRMRAGTSPEILRCVQNDTKLVFLENLRFDPREKENGSSLAKGLAEGHDLYVNEAFAVSHRAHASIVGIPQFLPSYAGIHFAEEIKQLRAVRDNPQRPLVFIIGGGKTDKIKYVKIFSNHADKILLGGVLMFEQSLENVPNVRFPVDAVKFYDIGPKSVNLFQNHLIGAKTIVWNGPLGKFEEEKYATGTWEIAKSLARMAQDQGTKVVVGGGDTLAALKKFGLRDKMDFVSTGGGAMLEFLTCGTLPGIEALN